MSQSVNRGEKSAASEAAADAIKTIVPVEPAETAQDSDAATEDGAKAARDDAATTVATTDDVTDASPSDSAVEPDPVSAEPAAAEPVATPTAVSVVNEGATRPRLSPPTTLLRICPEGMRLLRPRLMRPLNGRHGARTPAPCRPRSRRRVPLPRSLPLRSPRPCPSRMPSRRPHLWQLRMRRSPRRRSSPPRSMSSR